MSDTEPSLAAQLAELRAAIDTAAQLADELTAALPADAMRAAIGRPQAELAVRAGAHLRILSQSLLVLLPPASETGP